MIAALILLLVQGTLGAFDTLFYHEWKTALPNSPAARLELRLHASRDYAYAIVFGSLAWVQWQGWWAAVFVGILLFEIIITMWDFIEEDLTRKLPGGERVMHTAMAIIYGAFMAFLLPEVWGWFQQPSGFVGVDYGWLSWLMSAFAVGVFLSGVRDWVASVQLGRLVGVEG